MEDELNRLRDELARCKTKLAAFETGKVELLTDLLDCGKSRPLVTNTEELIDKLKDKEGISAVAWAFAKMEPHERTLQQTVTRLVSINADELQGPLLLGGLVYVSPHHVRRDLRSKPLAEVDSILGAGWKVLSTFKREWQAMLKNLASGNYSPMASRGVLFGSPGGEKSRPGVLLFYPAVITKPDGSRWWGMVQQPYVKAIDATWSLRDMLTMKHSSSFISALSCDTGRMLWQNAASMELFGCHGQFNSDSSDAEVGSSQHDFLELMFGSDDPDSLRDRMKAVTSKGGTFRSSLEVTNPALRSLMCLKSGQDMHLDCQISQTCNPDSLEKIFIVSQIDVTETVVAQRELQKAHEKLESEKIKMDVLLHRQKELIECLGWVSEVGASAGGNRTAMLIDSVRKQLSRTTVLNENGPGSSSGSVDASSMGEVIQMQELLGQGSFGKVFKGQWRGLTVAVKSMTLPINMSGDERKQRMALMEAAISASLVHCNIVKTHTYSIKPIRESRPNTESQVPSHTLSKMGSEGAISAFEVQIVLEYCDLGTLRDALTAGIFHSNSSPNYRLILDVALGIASGMQHLHLSNIIHADLKASNILLQSSETSSITAKIADFGLSISKVDASETHVSGMYQGTVTHMSPECLMTGQQSNAGDVYSFGITLYELYTATQAFKNIPLTFLGHKVSQDHLRPVFPPNTPRGYRDLAEACWDPTPSSRPTFDEVVSTLTRLKGEESGEIKPERISLIKRALSKAAPDAVNQAFQADSFLANAMDKGVLLLAPMDTAGSTLNRAAMAMIEPRLYDDAREQKSEKHSMMTAGMVLMPVDESVAGSRSEMTDESITNGIMQGIVLTPADDSIAWRD